MADETGPGTYDELDYEGGGLPKPLTGGAPS